jgi:hypothetical protein
MELADKGATIKSASISSSVNSFIVLMKTMSTIIITAMVIALAAIGTTAYVIEKGNDEQGKKAQSAGRLDPVSQTELSDDQVTKPRLRTSQFQSIEESEKALMAFDFSPIFDGGGREVELQCFNRLQSLAAKIPKSYYSELTRRMGEGSDMNIRQYFRQMTLYKEWGRVDFESALANLSSIEDKKLYSKALCNIFLGAMDANPLAAIKKAETLNIEAPGEFGDTERTELLDTIFDRWIESDPFSAVEWAKQAAVTDMRREQWIADGLREWGKKDPAAATKWRDQERF